MAGTLCVPVFAQAVTIGWPSHGPGGKTFETRIYAVTAPDDSALRQLEDAAFEEQDFREYGPGERGGPRHALRIEAPVRQTAPVSPWPDR